jgi:hypothetical protein
MDSIELVIRKEIEREEFEDDPPGSFFSNTGDI